MTSGYGYYEYANGGLFPNNVVSQYLRYTDLYYVSVERCEEVWGAQSIGNSVQCADKDGASICSGDSGGPLVMQVDGNWTLIGATSWAHVRCTDIGYPQGWSNLFNPEYNEWTRNQAGLSL